MARIALVIIILFLLVVFIHQLRNYFIRNKKHEELEASRLKTDMMDIDKEIAKERALQDELKDEIDDIQSQQKNNQKDLD